jgi:hypothetical protein
VGQDRLVSTELSFSFETIMPFFIPAVFVAIFGLVIWGSITQARKTRENLNQLASTLGLKIREPERTSIFSSLQTAIEGTFRGRSVRIYAYTTGSGKNRTAWCALSVLAKTPPGFSLKISGESVFTKVGRVFGVDDVQTGDPAFDARFYVRTKQNSYVRAALIPEVRMRLSEAWEKQGARGSFTAEAGEVKYAEVGTFAKPALCARFPLLLEIACELAEIAEAGGE